MVGLVLVLHTAQDSYLWNKNVRKKQINIQKCTKCCYLITEFSYTSLWIYLCSVSYRNTKHCAFPKQAAENWSVMLHFSVPKALMDFSKIWWGLHHIFGSVSFCGARSVYNESIRVMLPSSTTWHIWLFWYLSCVWEKFIGHLEQFTECIGFLHSPCFYLGYMHNNWQLRLLYVAYILKDTLRICRTASLITCPKNNWHHCECDNLHIK
jgi:hypothetical protein